MLSAREKILIFYSVISFDTLMNSQSKQIEAGWGATLARVSLLPISGNRESGEGGQEEKNKVRNKVECSGWGEGVKGRKKKDSNEVQGVEERKKYIDSSEVQGHSSLHFCSTVSWISSLLK